MNIHPNDNEETNKREQEDVHIPFDGFVNVNDLIRDRRNLKNAGHDAEASDTIGADSAE